MDDQSFSNSIATFSAKFCNELDKTKSVVSSPLSAEYVLALLALGSIEPTHSELLTALGVRDDDEVRSSFCEISSKIRSIQGVTLNVANRVYIMEGSYELDDNLQKDAVNVFDAGIEKVNFVNSQAAASLINSWVENKTNNRIKNLLTPDSFDENTRMVLVNALYFKGDWDSKFNPELTQDKPFHVNSTTKINIPMMYKEDEFPYAECQGLDSQILIMPYKGKSASMAIILPSQVDGLDNVLTKLAEGFDLMSALKNTFSVKVQVTIPKFKIETEIDLLQVLPKLGITSIFNAQKSGLDNMLKSPEPLYVSKAVQKAFIEVNEEGAEAAAATAVVRTRRAIAIADLQREFHVDRPALWCLMIEQHLVFLVRHQPSEPPPASHDEL
ncbi:serine protease inhibitor 3/4-like isoform X1 [Hyposmocoma kahamanoa]|nr:serine protease inhibitor 3/4-like isoform X1 [Hyposmocoma kahamanoa]